jgi:hypothetical protein
MSTVETFVGFFDYADPRVEDIHLEDVARALAMTCRFGGWVSRFYSVAEHALLCARLVTEAGHPELAFAALHHDSHEAYIGDVVTPLKRDMGTPYRERVAGLDAVVGPAFGINPADFHHPVIRAADALALRIEAGALKRTRGVGPHWGQEEPTEAPEDWSPGLSPEEAEAAFLQAHAALSKPAPKPPKPSRPAKTPDGMVRLEGGPLDGERRSFGHAMDTTLYVPSDEPGAWHRYHRDSPRERVATYRGVRRPTAPTTTTKKGGRR